MELDIYIPSLNLGFEYQVRFLSSPPPHPSFLATLKAKFPKQHTEC